MPACALSWMILGQCSFSLVYACKRAVVKKGLMRIVYSVLFSFFDRRGLVLDTSDNQ